MGLYKDFKRAVASTIDVLADKTSTQAQKSRLVTVMKNEEKIANQAYIALGKYLYTSLRDGMPEDVEQLCAVIDASKERMTRAQDIYREVIRQEQVNGEISRTEVRENFRKVKDPIVAGAVSTATKASEIVKDTAKDTAARAETIRAAAVERAGDIKTKLHREKTEAADEAEAAAPEAEDAEAEAVTEAPAAEEAPAEAAPAAEEAVEAPVVDAADESEPESEPQDEEAAPIQVDDGISEEEFEENEPVVKPADRRTSPRVRKLKDILTKKDEE